MTLAHLGLEFRSVPTRFTEIKSIEDGNFTTLPTIHDGETIMQDSFDIAKHYATGTPLLGGNDGQALVRFVESWSISQLHPWIAKWALVDIWNLLDAEDQAYFRTSREKAFGKTLEEVTANRQDTIGDLITLLLPMKLALRRRNFIGGDEPNFADYIVFGPFQWLRVASGLQMIPQDHAVMDWFKRCQDLHEGLGHSVSEGPLTT